MPRSLYKTHLRYIMLEEHSRIRAWSPVLVYNGINALQVLKNKAAKIILDRLLYSPANDAHETLVD